MPGRKNDIKCLLCKGEPQLFLNSYVKCLNCGLIRSPGLLKRQPKNWTKKDFAGYFQSREYFDNVFLKIVKHIEDETPKGRMLEIGCSVGMLLTIARKRGWCVYGVETAKWAAKYCRNQLKIPVFSGKFEKMPIPKNKFDVVVINHTLEHLVNPLTVLIKIRKMLRRNGLLFISVPNIKSIMFTVQKEEWPGLQKKQHLWQFNKETLKKLIEKAGFKNTEIWCETGFTPKAPKLKRIKELFLWFCDRIGRGESISLVVRA